LDTTIRQTKRDSWHGNKIKEKELRLAIRKVVGDEEQSKQIFEVVKQQDEYK
jgi:type I restriction enzyme R subunit